jgi:hypothetical protein
VSVDNKAMGRALASGEALDVNEEGRILLERGVWELQRFVPGSDYCDALAERWIWSIGRHLEKGTILASTGAEFYANPDFECLFLR